MVAPQGSVNTAVSSIHTAVLCEEGEVLEVVLLDAVLDIINLVRTVRTQHEHMHDTGEGREERGWGEDTNWLVLHLCTSVPLFLYPSYSSLHLFPLFSLFAPEQRGESKDRGGQLLAQRAIEHPLCVHHQHRHLLPATVREGADERLAPHPDARRVTLVPCAPPEALALG